jgi:hypothetical protein
VEYKVGAYCWGVLSAFTVPWETESVPLNYSPMKFVSSHWDFGFHGCEYWYYIFWNVTQCSLVGMYQCFGETCCLCLHGGGSALLFPVGHDVS